ncbi:aldolase [Aphanothece sacrum FPU1]|uniref:Aldolase n=1 Tax=Aphanothece sacrum FPU1 TaxID=1920663 RepID=A0A401IJD8_APHSA|nr:aldolase [Aphanothece sacrum FPU1]GBF85396.1 aldolase [Aphanothece sacrum FPU3]
MVINHLNLLLFTKDVSLAKQAEEAGVESIIVDWEQTGKHQRQSGYSTEINSHTTQNVIELAEVITIPITVRINPFGSNTIKEIETALDCGAKIIMLPMAKHPREVEKFLDLVHGRAETIIQIETSELVEHCHLLRDLSWNYAYIGLNDLTISRQKTWIWDLVADGTVEKIFESLGHRLIGFGGVTIISGGNPIPFINILHEMSRLNCRLSVLRRSFKREIVGRDFQTEIDAIRTAWVAASERNPKTIQDDHLAFIELLRDKKYMLYKV